MAKRDVLTTAQEKFAQLVAQGQTQTAAYRQAYPASLKWKETAVHCAASTLAAGNKVAERIRALQNKKLAIMEQRFELNIATWAKGLCRIAMADPRTLFHPDGRTKMPHELDDDIAGAIVGVKVKDGEIEYKLERRTSALDQIGRHLGAFERDNAQKSDSAVAALLTFIADRARLRAVPGDAARQGDVVDVQPAPTALLPKG